MTAADTTGSSPIASPSAPAVSIGDLVLRFLNTEHAGQWIRLEQAKCSIGASESCSLCLRTRFVQPLHAMIVRGRERTIVRSYASDSRINGRPFESAPLTAGDIISFGTIDFKVAALHHPADLSTEQLESTSIVANAPAMQSDGTRQPEIHSELQALARAKQVNRARTRRLVSDLRDANERIVEQQDRLAESNRRGEQLESRLNLLEERLAQLQNDYATAFDHQSSALQANTATSEEWPHQTQELEELFDSGEVVEGIESTWPGSPDEPPAQVMLAELDETEACEESCTANEACATGSDDRETEPSNFDLAQELGLTFTPPSASEDADDAFSSFEGESQEQNNEFSDPHASANEDQPGDAYSQYDAHDEQADQMNALRSIRAELLSDEIASDETLEQAAEHEHCDADEYVPSFVPEYTESDPWTPETSMAEAGEDGHDSITAADDTSLSLHAEPFVDSMASLPVSESSDEPPMGEVSFSEEAEDAAVESSRMENGVRLAHDDGDESIEAYMAKLLQRVRGENELVSLAPSRMAPPPNEQMVKQATPKLASEAATTFENAFAHEIGARQREFSSPKLMRRSEAPENRVELAAMREVANTSARSAIKESQQRRDTQVLVLQVTGAIIAMITGASMLGLANSLVSLTAFAALACWAGAAFLVYRTIALFWLQSGTTEPSSDDHAIDVEIVPPGEVDNPILATTTDQGDVGAPTAPLEAAFRLPLQADTTNP